MKYESLSACVCEHQCPNSMCDGQPNNYVNMNLLPCYSNTILTGCTLHFKSNEKKEYVFLVKLDAHN